METLIEVKGMYSKNRGMKFVIEKCAKRILKNRNREKAERIELQNEECITTLGKKENYKFFGILEANIIEQTEIKEKKTRREYFKKRRKLSEIKSCSRNLIKGINNLAEPLVRYLEPFLK